MQKVVSILVFLSLVTCGSLFAQKEIFLKQVMWKLDKISEVDYENEYFMTMKFNKGETYSFKIVNHVENFAGEAVIEVLDADKLVLTNRLGEKYFEAVNFVCNKTGFYDVLIRYKDNKMGHSVVDIFMVQ